MAIMSIVGEIAVKKSNGPGTLQTNFLDTLYSITLADIENTLKK
jgi:hydroxyethylthiazole kinase